MPIRVMEFPGRAGGKLTNAGEAGTPSVIAQEFGVREHQAAQCFCRCHCRHAPADIPGRQGAQFGVEALVYAPERKSLTEAAG